jgi:phytoene dehydrogenase-like protein
MTTFKTAYDVVIIGVGHNGLVAASYLGRAGLSVLMLERESLIGGATKSSRPFKGMDARLSVYSYLISLFPQQIVDDLGLDLRLRSRHISSYTPSFVDGALHELLVSNRSAETTRDSFLRLPGGAADYRGYLKLQEMQRCLARKIWPTLLEPLRSRAEMVSGLNAEERKAWDAYIENPLGDVIEEHIANDLVRGMLFTDAKVGVFTHPQDPLLLQNLTYLYHIIGRETGEWCVPVGGMGSLTVSLARSARKNGVTIATDARVEGLHVATDRVAVSFVEDSKQNTVDARFLLNNAAPTVLDDLLGKPAAALRAVDEGSVVKINMLLKRLPTLRSERHTREDAFSGTFHIDEGYEEMIANHRQAAAGQMAERPAGEMYCHTLTDNTILSDYLNAQSYHALTLFGMDMPYAMFEGNNERLRSEALEKFLSGINQYTREPIQECIAEDANGEKCVEIKTPVDLEREIHLPRGNIFHNALTWPFSEDGDEAGSWGVETEHRNVITCGSGARRGGAVSGVPGHNAAKRVLELNQPGGGRRFR